MADHSKIMHATTIYLDGYGIMITGASGIGKSALALDLLNHAHGFDYILLNSGSNLLVADDQTHIGINEVDGQKKLFARCPENIQGLFEVRGLGIIQLPFKQDAQIHLFVEIVDKMPMRMPEMRNQQRELLGVTLPYIQIYKHDTMAKARVKAALYAHTRDKLHSKK